MAVYREGYSIVEKIQKESKQIFSDACDFGVPVKKGDNIWNSMKQLTEWYGNPGSRVVNRYPTGRSVEIGIFLIDEWAVSDERKTLAEAEDYFTVSFVSCTSGACKGFEGYINIVKNNNVIKLRNHGRK